MSFTPSENPITHPTRESYTQLRPFRFWCQKVLPLVYDDSLSYYELLCKVVDYLNKTMEDVDHMNTDMDTLYSNFQEFQEGTFTIYNELVTYVNDYFDNLDVQEEINEKLDEMASDGSLTNLISPLIPDIVTAWLNDHVSPTSPVIDDTLTIRGAGADAKITGVKVNSLKNTVKNVNERSVLWEEIDSGYESVVTSFNYGYVSASDGSINDNLPLRGIYTDLLDGSELLKVMNLNNGTAGIRTFVYSSDGTFESYTTNGNVASITSFNSAKKYRFFIYPMATGGNSDSTYETLSSLSYNILFQSNNKVEYNIKENIELTNYDLTREKYQSVHWMEEKTGFYFLNTKMTYGTIGTSNGVPNPSLNLRGLYTDLINGSDIYEIINVSNGTGGVRTFIYSSDGTFERYTTNGNVASITSFDSTKKYRFFIYPMSTGGNSDSTYEILNNIFNNIYLISSNKIHKTYTVARDGSGQFSTIQEAIDVASDGDTIFIKSGYYTSTIVNTKQIHFIGENKHTTIIANSTGEYNTPPVLTCQGIWENLTIQAVKPDNPPTPSRIGFAIHLDTKWEYNSQKVCVIKNCIVLSGWSDAIGCGMIGGCVVELDNVLCKSVDGAGFKVHATSGYSGQTAKLYIKNSILVAENSGQHGFMIHSAGASAEEVNSITLQINNTVASDYAHYTTPMVYVSTNYGNNIAELNEI